MIETICVSQVRESNQPWFAMIAKFEQPNAIVMLAKFENYVLVIDPHIMSRGSVHIRSYERCYTKESAAANDGFYAQLGYLESLPPSHRLLHSRADRIIYPAELASVLSRFPIDDAMAFARAGIRRVQDVAYGDNHLQSEREKELLRKIKKMEQPKKNSKGKKNKPKRVY